MFTRSQYLNKECSHREYYAQFVTDYIKREIAFGMMDDILKSEDFYFNDVSLHRWDKRAYIVNTRSTHNKMKECNDTLSLNGIVCILKEAARQIKEDAEEIKTNRQA